MNHHIAISAEGRLKIQKNLMNLRSIERKKPYKTRQWNQNKKLS